MAEAWQIIDKEYLDQEAVEPKQMAYGAISGMTRALGDVGHTRFLSPRLAERHENRIEGELEGIGAHVEMREGRVVIISPIDDSPAAQAGIEPGDVILKVNGREVTQLSLDEVVDRILGPTGTQVTLTLLDPDTETRRTVTLERATIELDLVTWQQLPGTRVAYVRISAFGEGASADLRGTLSEIQTREKDGVILDLRNNPGGLLSEAIGVASQLVENGNVLFYRDAAGEISPEPVKEGVQATGMPMVALANAGTASAAEIVVGALQDHERAAVVGETTSGAGTVLTPFTLSDGSLLLLAVEEWLTPDRRVIWQEGLVPDIEVSLPPDAEPIDLSRHVELTEREFEQSADAQLFRALELLQN
jgi:carboxyl-terminal processing protease